MRMDIRITVGSGSDGTGYGTGRLCYMSFQIGMEERWIFIDSITLCIVEEEENFDSDGGWCGDKEEPSQDLIRLPSDDVILTSYTVEFMGGETVT